MIKKIIILCVGLTCAAGAAQAPEFTQQYLQKLGGWVDSYNDRVARLDLRAGQFDMTRPQYIAALEASADPKVRNEAANIATWPVYLERFSEMQNLLRTSSSWMKPFRLLQNYFDPTFSPIVKATFAEYKAAAPINGEGVAFGGAGFIVGWILTGIGGALLRAPMKMIRRREGPKDTPHLVTHRLDELKKTEPSLSTVLAETDKHMEADELSGADDFTETDGTAKT